MGGTGHVDIWLADLRDAAWDLDRFEGTLSATERARAERFHRAGDRRDFVVGRGLLRRLLSRYTGRRAVELTNNRWGKPRLASSGPGAVQFNVSHSGGLIALAFGNVESIGVDVEALDRRVRHLELAERFFAPGERATLAALPREQLATGFFNCWTRKEAVVKAHGMGLSLPLDAFEVSLQPGEPAELLWATDELPDAHAWELREFAPGPGYVAALVAIGTLSAFRELRLDPAALAAL